LKRGSEVLQKFDYSYGQLNSSGNPDPATNNGQLAQIEAFIGAAKQRTQKFTYDSIGRLSKSEEYRGDTSALTYKQVFDYDRFGNLYRKAGSNPTTGQQNPLPTNWIEDEQIDKSKNQFLSWTGVTYNEAGQVTTDTKFRNMNFGYDANGRMVNVHSLSSPTSPDSKTVYDALGNRVATKINDVWQYMIYDAFGQLVAEYGARGEGVGGVKFVQQDHQGSVRTVTDAHGNIVSRSDYQAFGDEIDAGIGLRTSQQGYGAGSAARQGYGLTEKDDASGQQHTWFRKLETQAGRFSSLDPYSGSMSVSDPQSFNRYSYVGGDPTNHVDPSGLAWHFACTAVGDPNNPGVTGPMDCTPFWVSEDTRWRGYDPIDHPPANGDPGTGPSAPPEPPQGCDHSFLPDAYWVENGRRHDADDLNVLARLIYAEANPDPAERDAVASVIYSRLSSTLPSFAAVASSGQFEAVTGPDTRAFDRTAPNVLANLSAADCNSFLGAIDAVVRMLNNDGPLYPQFGAFRGGRKPLKAGMTLIGGSRFAASDSVFNPPRPARKKRR
jgi:RHS repeat-associated protein